MTTDERLRKIEAWMKAAEGRDLVARVEALEEQQLGLYHIVDKLLGGLEKVLGRGKA